MTVQDIIDTLKQNPGKIRVRDEDGTEFEAIVTFVDESPAIDEYDSASFTVGLETEEEEVPGKMQPDIFGGGTGEYEYLGVYYYAAPEERTEKKIEELEVLNWG